MSFEMAARRACGHEKSLPLHSVEATHLKADDVDTPESKTSFLWPPQYTTQMPFKVRLQTQYLQAYSSNQKSTLDLLA